MDNCPNAAIFDTNVCEDCLEMCAIENALNMGTPETVRCGHCEQWFKWDDFVTHQAVLEGPDLYY
jgi:hypothetical protein